MKDLIADDLIALMALAGDHDHIVVCRFIDRPRNGCTSISDSCMAARSRHPLLDLVADRAEPVVQIGLPEEIRFDANRTGRCDDIAAQTSNRDLESFSGPNVRFFSECDNGIAT